VTPLDHLRALIDDAEVDVAVLRSRAAFAWVTGGGSSTVLRSAAEGVATLVVDPDGVTVVAPEIEAPRLAAEEPVGDMAVVTHPWWEPADRAVADVVAGRRVGADLPRGGEADLGPAIARVRSALGAEALAAYRVLCRDAAAIVEAACRSAVPGGSEHDLAAAVAGPAARLGIEPVVLLVGGDERLLRHRHPVPTAAPVARAAMVVLCGARHGLVANVTRTVRFAPPDAEEAARAAAVAAVHARLRAATTPGRAHADLFALVRDAYAEAGFPGAERGHHQGGAAGYAPRERLIGPDADGVVAAGEVYAWNPSVPGAKSEDTVLAGADGSEVLTETGGWPRLPDGPGARSAAELVVDRG
jgi:Xaa-Pro dipeptidase